ncbi:MAG: hypothetical protein ACOC1X_00345, partial [Promethearchaeota archaeon]
YGSTDSWETLVDDYEFSNTSLTHFKIVPYSYYYDLHLTDGLTNETESYGGNTFSAAWRESIDNVRFQTNDETANNSIIIDAFSIHGHNYTEGQNLYTDDYKYEVDRWDFRINPETRRVYDSLTNYYYPWDALSIDARRDLAVSIQGWQASGTAQQKETYKRISDSTETYLQFACEHNVGETFYFDRSVNYLSTEEVKLESVFSLGGVNESSQTRFGQYVQIGGELEGIYLLKSNISNLNTSVVYKSGADLTELDSFNGSLQERTTLTTYFYPYNHTGVYVLRTENEVLSTANFEMGNEFIGINKLRIHTSHSQQGYTNLYSVGFYAHNPYNDDFSSYAKQATGGFTLDYVLQDSMCEKELIGYIDQGREALYTMHYSKPEQINVILDGNWAIEYGDNPSFNLRTYDPTSNNIGYLSAEQWFYDYENYRHIYPLYYMYAYYLDVGSNSLLFLSQTDFDTAPKEIDIAYVSIETLRIKFESEIDDSIEYYYPEVSFRSNLASYFGSPRFYGYVYWIDSNNRLQFTHNTRLGYHESYDKSDKYIEEFTRFEVDIDSKTFADVSAVIPGKMYSYNDSDYVSRWGINGSFWYDYNNSRNNVKYSDNASSERGIETFQVGFELGNNSYEHYNLTYEYKEYGDNLTQGAYSDKIVIQSNRYAWNTTDIDFESRKGYIEYIKLEDPIWLDVNLLKIDGFLAVLPVLIVLIIPTFLIYKRFQKAIIVPIMFMVMSIICFATSLISLWLFFIIMVGLLFFIFIIGKYGDEVF